MRRPLIALILGVCAAAPLSAQADETQGVVVAHDRVSHRVVMGDKSVYQYDPEKTVMPETLRTGDTILIDFTGSEDGIESINSITVIEAVPRD